MAQRPERAWSARTAVRGVTWRSALATAYRTDGVEMTTPRRTSASACATNPLPLVLPCHRVVRADGSLGRYLGGEEVKAQLIALEADTLAGGTTTARGPGTHAS